MNEPWATVASARCQLLDSRVQIAGRDSNFQYLSSPDPGAAGPGIIRWYEPDVAKQEYQAHCHCGRVRFSFRCDEITTGKRCNCSICIRKGAVVSSEYIPATDFTPHANPDDLGDYRWNDRLVNHLFCKTCGIYPYHGNDEYGYRVNLGCVEGIDPLSLEIGILDGRSLPLREQE